MEKKKHEFPILRDIKALYESADDNRRQIEETETRLKAATDELAIHGEVIGNMETAVSKAKEELAIHGEVIGNTETAVSKAKEELAIHEEVIGNLQNETATHGAAIGTDRKQIEILVSEICSLKARVNELERLLEKSITNRNSKEQTETDRSAMDSERTGQVLKTVESAEDSYYSIDYFDFENKFRGSRETIMDRQRIYLPYFQGCENVVDIGCGRGEFLELMYSQKIGATGVDMYEPYVEYVKLQGLPCVCADANEYLKNAEKIDGIFLGQVVEHLSTSQMIELVNNAYDALEEGRYLIMETPNPMTLSVFSHAFYMDPSHEKPVHPYTLKYITEKAGFSSVDILFTDCSRVPFHIPELKVDVDGVKEFNQAMKQLSEDLYGSQDYAIIARK